MIFKIKPKDRNNKLLSAVRLALQHHAPIFFPQWEGVLSFDPDLVKLELFENRGQQLNPEPAAGWAAFGDRPPDIVAGWLLGQLWRYWEE